MKTKPSHRMAAYFRKFVLAALFMVLSDLYRMIAAVLDWRCHLRVLSGKGKYDVAFINNVESETQKQFLGIFQKKKDVAYCLRFSLGKSLCRSLLINSSAHDLVKPNSRQLAKNYTRSAIQTAVRDGARIILFAAGTKRLFSENDLAEIRQNYPNVIFTIGDNGTAIALLADVLHAIQMRELKADSMIAILGPNGFLGEVVTRFLQALGYNHLLLLSSSVETPFADVSGVELIVACSHHVRLRLTAGILARISCERGAYVIDVCRPCNLSKKEFLQCKNVVRQDSGMVHNNGLRFVFPFGAMFVLRRLGISTRILYGCFGEAVALSILPQGNLKEFDFLSVNPDTMRFMEQTFSLAGFMVSPVHNFGRATGMVASSVEWNIAKHFHPLQNID